MAIIRPPQHRQQPTGPAHLLDWYTSDDFAAERKAMPYIDWCTNMVDIFSIILFNRFLCPVTYFTHASVISEKDENNLEVSLQVDDEAQPKYPGSDVLVLGKFDPEERMITFYQKSIECEAERSAIPGLDVHTLTLAVALRELMDAIFYPVSVLKTEKVHAHFKNRNIINNSYLMEPICEAGVLAVLKDHMDNEVIYTTIKKWLESKSNDKATAHQGFGAYLHDKKPGLKLQKTFFLYILVNTYREEICWLMDEFFSEDLYNREDCKTEHPELYNYISCFKPEPKSQEEMYEAFTQLCAAQDIY